MLGKLRRRIRLFIQIPMILLILLISALYLHQSYNGIIGRADNTMYRFSAHSGDQKAENIDDLSEKQPNGKDAPPDKPDENNELSSSDSENVYEFEFSHSEIKYQSTDDKDLVNAARSLAKGRERSGVSGGMFYRVEKRGDDVFFVRLLVDDDLYKSLVFSILSAVGILVLGVVIIILFSYIILKIITKPVVENENKQKTFITDTSHELKTPLAVMQANADVLATEIGENKRLDFIKEEIDDLEGLVSSLLLLARSEYDGDREGYREFNASEKAEYIASFYESVALEKNITFDTDIQPDLMFKGDEFDFEQILSPLIDNALEHTHNYGTINLSVFLHKKELVIVVENRGDPIPEKERVKVFDRFYRIDRARTRGEKHYGLGLAMVRAIAIRYGGKAYVTCADGITSFTVRLKQQ